MSRADIDLARELLLAVPTSIGAADWLYERWYHRIDERRRVYPSAAAYHAASVDPARYVGGWSVVRAGLPGIAAGAEVSDGTRRRHVAPPDIVPEDPEALVFSVGQSVRVNPYTCSEEGGFFHIQSSRWQDEGFPDRRQRLYFAVQPGAEAPFVADVLGAASVGARWAMKILSGTTAAGRRDVAVLYLDVTEAVRHGWVAAVCERARPHLRRCELPMTREVAPGVAWAPDPTTERSFGQLLCEALAALSREPGLLADVDRWRVRASEALQRQVSSGSER